MSRDAEAIRFGVLSNQKVANLQLHLDLGISREQGPRYPLVGCAEAIRFGVLSNQKVANLQFHLDLGISREQGSRYPLVGRAEAMRFRVPKAC